MCKCMCDVCTDGLSMSLNKTEPVRHWRIVSVSLSICEVMRTDWLFFSVFPFFFSPLLSHSLYSSVFPSVWRQRAMSQLQPGSLLVKWASIMWPIPGATFQHMDLPLYLTASATLILQHTPLMDIKGMSERSRLKVQREMGFRHWRWAQL